MVGRPRFGVQPDGRRACRRRRVAPTTVFGAEQVQLLASGTPGVAPAPALAALRLAREPPQAIGVAIVRRNRQRGRVAALYEHGVERAAVGEPQVDERAPVPVAGLGARE